MSTSAARVAEHRQAIDDTLRKLLPPEAAPPADLHAAMRHALLAPGKRLRPLFTLLTAGDHPAALACAAVSEMVHTASLILDDLPCMDNASVRRNLPCVHIIYSESVAILAATNLLNLAFGTLARQPAITPAIKAELAAHLADIVGSGGLIGGQVCDLHNDLAAGGQDIEKLYQQKTGGLFEFALLTGARLAEFAPADLHALARFARTFGLAFQIYDDLLDTADAAGTGKTTGRDVDKATFLNVTSPTRARAELASLYARARAELAAVGPPLPELRAFVEAQIKETMVAESR